MQRAIVLPHPESVFPVMTDTLPGPPHERAGTKLPVKPNFFILGAPKCGTTALYNYLSHHPNIFMSRVKEPHFFARDLGTYPRIKRIEEYTALFSRAREQHLRVGEASVYYLRSRVAIPNIREFNPDARLIAMFRNPVDMVASMHAQLLYWSEETVADFEGAWRLQERRSQGLDLPRRSRGAFLLQYREVGRFGTQVQRLLATFPRSQIKLILYDDIAASPQAVYDDVIAFLELPHDGRTEFPRINENKRARLPWLRNFYRKPPPPLRNAVRTLKRAIGSDAISSVKEKIVDVNTVRERRTPLSPEFRAELVETFREEVELLSRLVGRDLSHWV
jgi:Sulfotransferase domain